MSEHLTFDQYEHRREILRYLQNRSLAPSELHQALLYLPEDMFLQDPIAQTMTHFRLTNDFEANEVERFMTKKLKNPVPPVHLQTFYNGNVINPSTFLLENRQYVYFFKPSYLQLTEEEGDRAQELGLPYQYHQYAKPLQRIPMLGGFVHQYDDRHMEWIMQDEHALPTRWESMEMKYIHIKHSLSTFLDNPTE